MKEYISLGYSCCVAESLSRYGLRGFSGVFDWLNSRSFLGVIQLIENDFSDFLKMDLLEISDDLKKFRNIKYNLWFLHEVKTNFYDDYQEICLKYHRRINRFREKMRGGVICIRVVAYPSDFKWILQNETYIQSIIKRDNPNNEIIYVLPRTIKVPASFKSKYFILKKSVITEYINYREIFDTNSELVAWLINQYDDVEKKKNNLIYDLQQMELKLKQHRYSERNPNALMHIDNAYGKAMIFYQMAKTDFAKWTIPKKVVIYGMKLPGKLLCDKISDKCEELYLIDNCIQNRTYQNKKIWKIEEIPSECLENSLIIITITSPDAHQDIKMDLKNKWGNRSSIVSLDEWLEPCYEDLY